MNKLKSFIKSSSFEFYGTILLVLFIITIKITGSGSQPSLFSNILKKYIEETSASVKKERLESKITDISSLLAFNHDLGQGGEEDVLNPAIIQNNSLIATDPMSIDYINYGFKKNQVLEYTIQAGDLLSFIASDYGVSIDSIIWANNLSSPNNLKSGQVIRIPPISGVIHKIKNGDTLVAIAKKYSVDIEKIKDFNGLSEDGQLQVDTEIVVPDGNIRSSSVVKAGTKTNIAHATKRFAYLPDMGDFFLKPSTGFNWGKVHGRNGIDIANSCGTPIYAAAEGLVSIADASGWNGGFGKYIKLIHSNGTETLYAHLGKTVISVGSYVSKGQLLGLIGTTGRSTGCHLHFEVHGARNPFAKY